MFEKIKSPRLCYEYMKSLGMSHEQIDSFCAQLSAINARDWEDARYIERIRLSREKNNILRERALESDDDKAPGVVL